jgi:WD40 repeat protein
MLLWPPASCTWWWVTVPCWLLLCFYIVRYGCLLWTCTGTTDDVQREDVAPEANFDLQRTISSASAPKLHLLRDLSFPRRPGDVAVSTGSHDGNVLFAVGKAQFQSGHTDVVSAVSYSPVDPDLLASCSYDLTVRLWNTSSLEQLAVMTGHSAPINSVVFNK